MELLTEGLKLTMVKNLTANGTGNADSDALDMAGYDGVVFFTKIASNAADTYLSALQGDTDNPTTAIAGSGVLTSAANNVAVLDIFRPTKRYVRARVVRGTTTVLGEIYALQYHARSKPQVNAVTNVQAIKQLISPAEGAAV